MNSFRNNSIPLCNISEMIYIPLQYPTCGPIHLKQGLLNNFWCFLATMAIFWHFLKPIVFFSIAVSYLWSNPFETRLAYQFLVLFSHNGNFLALFDTNCLFFLLQCPTCGPIHLQQGPDSFRCFGPSLCCSPTKGCLSGSLPGKVSKDKIDSNDMLYSHTVQKSRHTIMAK